VPRSIAGRCCIERGKGTLTRCDAPRGECSGKSWPPVAGEKEAGRARSLCGKTKPPGGKLGQAFRLSECGAKGQALQPLFERPGGVLHRPCLDDEETRRVQTESDEARSIRASPFARNVLGEAPDHELAAN
jgi:hypothetical protein